ncbi:hypothetical protein, partial [Streptomyces sp. BE303]|uniref:hypothetical protein n=1 Tax=Streptomyces sp. BE303 TaxID=3002528 RepID=UPI002E76F8F9
MPVSPVTTTLRSPNSTARAPVFNDEAPTEIYTEIYTLSQHAARPIFVRAEDQSGPHPQGPVAERVDHLGIAPGISHLGLKVIDFVVRTVEHGRGRG